MSSRLNGMALLILLKPNSKEKENAGFFQKVWHASVQLTRHLSNLMIQV
jgi:hypothetical protein